MPKRTAKASAIVIQSARLSFIWAEVLPGFLQQLVPEKSPYAFLTRSFLFPEAFETARDGRAEQPKLEAPWLSERKQQFWMRYLVQGKLREVPGSQAWDYLVPLRTDPGIQIEANWFDGSTFIDAFYLPFGVAAAISFRWQPGLSLKDFLPKAYDFAKYGKFSLAGGPSQSLSLEQVADKVLTALRKNALGDGSQGGFRTQQPLSLTTIVEAQGVNPDADVRKETSILHALEVLTNWPADYEYLKLPNPNDVCLPAKSGAPAGSALYAKRRGRAVWLPALFRTQKTAPTLVAVDQSRRASKLGCYHRNLFFASLQTECLGLLISYTAQLFSQGKHKADLTAHHRNVAHNAAKCLAKLYLGDKSKTWRSASVQRQIRDNCFADLQAVLGEFSEDKLPQP
jgi:hypothetical protein